MKPLRIGVFIMMWVCAWLSVMLGCAAGPEAEPVETDDRLARIEQAAEKITA